MAVDARPTAPPSPTEPPRRWVREGIETPGQLRRLHGLGCRVGQGFHFARPMPGDALAAYFSGAQAA